MNLYKVALFGHRDFSAHRILEERLYPLLCELAKSKPVLEILIGRNGEFDIFAATIVKKVQRSFGKENCFMSLVLPYHHKDIEYFEEYYDDVFIPEALTNSHPKAAITKRNKFIVEECDLVVCYIENESGGAFSAVEYAKKLDKNIINLAE